MAIEKPSIISMPLDSPQAFRPVYRNNSPGLKLSQDIIYITPKLDPECGLYVIFFDEVLKYFKDAIRLRKGRSSLIFMSDMNSLYPLRFHIAIGVIIDVIIENPIDNPADQIIPSSTPPNPFVDPRPVDDSAFEDLLLSLDATRGIGLTMRKAIGGDALSQVDIAAMYNYLHFNYSKAMEWYLKAADQGNSIAFYSIGNIYFQGYGSYQEDYKIAKEWFIKAAAQEYAPAQTLLGIMHHDGIEYPKNPRIALDFYLKADKQGCPVAPMNIAQLYEYELAGPQNAPKVMEWYFKAAER
ncbi:hypothetical protein BGZ76_000435, partial [Entomortierella beljakovae]